MRESKLHSIIDTFLRFCGAGIVGTAAHYVLLVVLVEAFKVAPVVASSCGAILGGLVNYLLNYHFTFKSAKSHVETVPKFATVALIGVVINGFVVYVLVNFSLNYILAQVIATGVVLMWGFVANYLWTFVKPQNKST